MTDRIDHAAEALRVIMTLPSGDTFDQAYAYAQVHATLALVEQQRIANVIALANVADSLDTAVTPLGQAAWETLGIRGSGQIRPGIATALGIETGAGDA